MILCIRNPSFIVSTTTRDTEWQGQDVIVHDGIQVLAASHAVLCSGIAPGMNLKRAQVIHPDVPLVAYSPTKIALEKNAIADSLGAFTDRIEMDDKGTIYLNLGKLPEGETPRQVGGIIKCLYHVHHQSVRVGIAATKFVARVAADVPRLGSYHLIQAGQEINFLAGKSVDYLPFTKKARHELVLLGLERMGQISCLARSALFTRFGYQGVFCHDLSCGKDFRQVAQLEPTPIEIIEHPFDDPVDNLQVLQVVISQLSKQLAARLARDDVASQTLTLKLICDDKSQQEELIRCREPVWKAAALAERFRTRLENAKIQSPVCLVSLYLTDIHPIRPVQLSLGLFETKGSATPPLKVKLIQLERRKMADKIFMPHAFQPSAPLLIERRFQLWRASSV